MGFCVENTYIIELHVLRDMLMHKYGRDFSIAVMENKDGCVSERVNLSSVHVTVTMLTAHTHKLGPQ